MTLRSLIRTATAAPIARRPEDPIFTAVDRMAEHDRNAVLVTSGSGLMRGIVTDQDIIRHLHKQRGRIGEATVSDAMTRNVVTCPPETSLGGALSLMGRHAIRHLVVVEGDAPVGVLAIRDVLTGLHDQDLLEIDTLRDIARTTRVLDR